MKGITNFEIKEYFENITQDLEEMKSKKATSSTDTTLFLIATIAAIVSTLLYVLHTEPVLLFFIISGLASMAVILVKKQFESKK